MDHEKVNILLVDDQPAKLLAYEVILKDLGENLVAATSGREALEILLKNEIAVILVDVCMPELDGFEATLQIRNQEATLNGDCPWPTPVYIVALTASAMRGDREKCLAVGMNDYVTKPMNVADMQTALERWKPGAQVAPALQMAK